MFSFEHFFYLGEQKGRTEQDRVIMAGAEAGSCWFWLKNFHTQGFVRWRMVVVKPPLLTVPQLGVFSELVGKTPG
jgi:hypothetical protein